MQLFLRMLCFSKEGKFQKPETAFDLLFVLQQGNFINVCAAYVLSYCVLTLSC